MQFFKVIENFAKREENKGLEVTINSLRIDLLECSQIEAVKMKEALKNFKV
jgi:hypothetical protein